jgi:hypothetical protein
MRLLDGIRKHALMVSYPSSSPVIPAQAGIHFVFLRGLAGLFKVSLFAFSLLSGFPPARE